MNTRTSFVRSSRAQWSSEPAFIFSMAAAAVGLGNLWRFPYILGANGGGAFLIAYFAAIIIVVLPLMILEVAAGRLAQGSVVATFRQVNRFGAFYGWFVVLVTTIITSYYLVITGWTLGYAVDAVRGELRPFDAFSTGYNSLWFFLIVAVLVGAVLIRGVALIERISWVLMPVLLLVMIGLVVAASQTPGWTQAKDFFFQVDFSRLTDSKLWVFAFGQAFYSLAIGQGYLVTYGSFIPKKTHVPRASVIVAATETSVALLAGWMIFPFLFSHGLAPDEGSQLAFVTLPRVFENMAGGSWIATLFFGLFFVAAFSSSVAGTKVLVAAIAEELRLTNTTAVIAVTALLLVLGSASALSFTPLNWQIAGEPVLDVLDRVAGGNLVIFSGVVGAALLCWFVPAHRIVGVLGARGWWWEWRIYLIGRLLPLALLLWVMISHALTLINAA